MKGPFELKAEKVKEVVTRTSSGNYALGYVNNSSFYVKYVGRSDSDVKSRLLAWANTEYSGLVFGVKKTKDYTHFEYSLAISPKAAFEKECKNYHDFGEDKKLDNKNHPQRPDNTAWKCPFCNIYD